MIRRTINTELDSERLLGPDLKSSISRISEFESFGDFFSLCFCVFAMHSFLSF